MSSELLAATPRINIQNDTDKYIAGAYTATILNDNQQTEDIEDTFPVPTGISATPPLPYYLINQRIAFTSFFEGGCTSTVTFRVENRGGAFNIIEPNSDGATCISNGIPRRLSATQLHDGFTILLLEETPH